MKTFKSSFRLCTAIFTLCIFSMSSMVAPVHAITYNSMTLSDTTPTASFSIVNNNVAVGTPIQFNNESSGADSYLWDFGDGTFSTEENPAHVYANPGNYTVKLMVIGGGSTVEFIGTEDAIAF